MATSTIIQFLGNEAAGGTAATMNRRQIETFIAGGNITAKDFVMFDTAATGSDRVLTVKQASTVATVGQALTVGVALTGATTGNTVDVVIAGYCEANVDAATVAGSALIGPITTAGRADIAAAATTAPVIAVALAADTSNVAPVCVFRLF